MLADAMGEAEQQHVKDTLATGTIALETSKIALQKAQNAWVKKFAEYEVAEQ
jgi:putative membrane protein